MEGDQEQFTVCPYCRERVEPGDPGVVYAVEQRELTAFGPTRHVADGMGGYFHASCPPEAVGYARRPRPES
jgi:hypothetical protein